MEEGKLWLRCIKHNRIARDLVVPCQESAWEEALREGCHALDVSVPVLLHLLAEVPTLRTALVMVQLEVADRLAAAPGSRVYGVPSVKAGFYGTVRRTGVVGRNVFWPVPNVESGLVRIDRYDEAPWDMSAEHRRRVFAVADAAFAQRRKTLRAALSGWAGSGARAAAYWQANFADVIERMLTGGLFSPKHKAQLDAAVSDELEKLRSLRGAYALRETLYAQYDAGYGALLGRKEP